MNTISQEFTRVINLSNKPKVILSNNLINMITQAHYYAGQTEWSGLLLYKEISGSIEDLDNLALKCDYLHLMNIGSETFTSIEVDENICELGEEFIDFMDYKIGKIHTHHSLGFTTHSATDIRDLENNASCYNYYLSVIVDYKGKWGAKIAMLGKEIIENRQLLTKNNKLFNWFKKQDKVETDVLYMMDCEIELEDIVFSNNNTFIKRCEKLKKEKTGIIMYPAAINNQYQGSLWEDIHSNKKSNKPVKNTFDNNKYKTPVRISEIEYDNFLVKLINHDITAEGLLETSLKAKEKLFTKAGKYIDEEAEKYIDLLETNFWNFVEDCLINRVSSSSEKLAILGDLKEILDPYTFTNEFALDLYSMIEGMEFIEETAAEDISYKNNLQLWND